KRVSKGLSNKLVDGILKFGGHALMMWCCMTWKEVEFATKIDGRIDGDLYLQIFEDELQKTFEYYYLNPYKSIF
ncbi:hypothetical protein SERLA73DRAFT_44294, partial [Serpula lacrymans var. lacrymans S7.3]